MARYDKDIANGLVPAKASGLTDTGKVDINSDSGDINFQDGDVNQLSLNLDGAAGDIIVKLMVNGDDLVFQQYDGYEVLRLKDNGNVGIGGEPTTTLHVQADDPRVRVDATVNNHPGFEISEAGTRKWLMYNQPNSGADDLIFKSASDRLKITPAGNVILPTDSSEISMGVHDDVTFTHDGTTGLEIGANPISMVGAKGVNTLMTPAIADFSDNECIGEIIKIGTGSLTAGDLYFFHTDGAWYATDADNVDYGGTELLGVALGTSPTTHGMLVRGITRVASANVEGTPALGVSVYISESHTAQFDFTAPSGGSDYVRRLGHCLAIDSGNVLLLFNPSLEHTAL